METVRPERVRAFDCACRVTVSPPAREIVVCPLFEELSLGKPRLKLFDGIPRRSVLGATQPEEVRANARTPSSFSRVLVCTLKTLAASDSVSNRGMLGGREKTEEFFLHRADTICHHVGGPFFVRLGLVLRFLARLSVAALFRASQ
jgi:hypothetical protein